MSDTEETVAWMACPYRAPVLDSEGGTIGTAESLLGDEAEDIFHGIAVKRTHGSDLVEIAANDIVRITKLQVYTHIPPADVATLTPYREQKWFHLGGVGTFASVPNGNRQVTRKLPNISTGTPL
jgi:hypothetical protein